MLTNVFKSSKLFQINSVSLNQNRLASKFTTATVLPRTTNLNLHSFKNDLYFKLKRSSSTKSYFDLNLNHGVSFQPGNKKDVFLKPKKHLLLKSIIASLIISSVSLFGLAYLFQKNVLENKEEAHNKPKPKFILLEVLFPFQISEHDYDQEWNWESIKYEMKFRLDALAEILKYGSSTQKIIYSIALLNVTTMLLKSSNKFRKRYYTLITGCFYYKPALIAIITLDSIVLVSEYVDILGLKDYELARFFITSIILCALARRIAFCCIPKFYYPIFTSPGSSGLETVRSDGKWINSFYNDKGDLNLPRSFFPTLGVLGIILGCEKADYAILVGSIYGHVYAKWGSEFIWRPVNETVFHLRIYCDNQIV